MESRHGITSEKHGNRVRNTEIVLEIETEMKSEIKKEVKSEKGRMINQEMMTP